VEGDAGLNALRFASRLNDKVVWTSVGYYGIGPGMFRKTARFAILFALGLSGCTTGARYVTTTSTCGIVAIPSNSDKWPNYYRKQAEELLQAKCPDGYVIELEEEFIPGANQRKRRSDGSTETTGFFDHTEWRIYYRRKDAPEGATTALMVHPPPVAAPLGVQQAVGLTPVVMPLGNTPGVNYSMPGMPPRPTGVVPASQQ
jgi:hypothetical protein